MLIPTYQSNNWNNEKIAIFEEAARSILYHAFNIVEKSVNPIDPSNTCRFEEGNQKNTNAATSIPVHKFKQEDSTLHIKIY